MRQRAISAAVLALVVVVAYLLGNPWLTIGLAALAILAGGEAASLIRRAGLPADPGIVVLLPAFFVLLVIPRETRSLAIGYAAIALGLSAVAAFRKRDLSAAFLTWVGGAFGAIWVGGLTFAALILTLPDDLLLKPWAVPVGGGRSWLVILVLTVWACDTFAYLVGRAFPRGRMLPHLSPNKTWSGGIAGAVAGAVVCAFLASSQADWDLISGAAIGLLISVAAQAGDAAESLLKRGAGVKDSGTLIPGHGGVLDRIDSFLFAAPALYLVLAALPGPRT
jgi:phosphatidate cytidylyltransferase